MESEQGAGPGVSERSGGSTWPPPHSSPPAPPPREYGSPGTPDQGHPWVWAVVAAVVLGLLISGGLAYVVSGIGDDDSASDDRSDVRPTAAPSQAAQSTDPSSSPSASTSAPASDEPSAAAATYTCWDGTTAAKVKRCSLPHGEEGLRYAYPSMATERCGPAQYSRKDGALLRIVCRHVLTSGAKVQVGYYEWQSVEAAVAFFTGQGLATTQQDAAGSRFSGTTDGTLKLVQLYAEVGLSQTITAPAGTQLAPEDLTALAQRPAAQLRGVQAG
ncbi:hypothetical protein G5V58_24815 [Nocardioides anomalus]|uniref:Uncharacterized protein n=1 Tax=Nocardioides anomalus TaxID=2712223 RepID=A0A6G6WJY2_9ACTN|nr:hypothetical protein [Nocardioides anomalus]QIG45539.1 hypothetical protein G5V58_24815 [Nocardioides anomalus]